MIRSNFSHGRFVGLVAASMLALAACGDQGAGPAEGEAAAVAAGEYERGPHGGRLLRSGDFALELTVFEEGVPPRYRVYPYLKDKPLEPLKVQQLAVAVTRLGGRVDRFSFRPTQDYLEGEGVLVEPHSFDVAVSAAQGGQRHAWRFASYEGRTTIAPEAAQAGGVKVEQAGPAELGELITLPGRVELQPQGLTEVGAKYPGPVISMTKSIGDFVRRGETIARVESSWSLQTYSIPAPMSGVVVERKSNPGSIAGEAPLYVIADSTRLHAEFLLYPRDAERIRPGQSVQVRSLTGEQRALSSIEVIPPSTETTSQTALAHVVLPNPGGQWRPGMAVEGDVTVALRTVPLAVRTRALQRFRDFTVVFAKVGDTYEVRMLELGRQTPEWTEVLGGLEPGTTYVTDGAFLIRADIEKSGASHDH